MQPCNCSPILEQISLLLFLQALKELNQHIKLLPTYLRALLLEFVGVIVESDNPRTYVTLESALSGALSEEHSTCMDIVKHSTAEEVTCSHDLINEQRHSDWIQSAVSATGMQKVHSGASTVQSLSLKVSNCS